MTFYKRLKSRWPAMTRQRLMRSGFDRKPVNSVIKAAEGGCPFNSALLILLAQKAATACGQGTQLELDDFA